MNSIIRIAVSALAALTFAAAGFSQNGPQQCPKEQPGFQNTGSQKGKKDWKETMKAEKIAFLTSEMGLTSQEAEVFWPLYNEAEEYHFKSMDAVMEAYRNLEAAVAAKEPEQKVSAALDAYLRAVRESNNIDSEYVAKYKKVISTEKVAKLFIAEEKFRRQQISRFHRGDAPKNRP